MKATLYRELKNKKEIIELKTGISIKENLKQYDTSYSVIVANNKIVKDNYIVCQNDIITIRLIPAGATAMIVTGIVIAVVAITAGIVGGIIAYKAKLAAQEAQEALEKLKKQTNQSSSIDNRPFIRGASNTPATGKLQPYICGRSFLSPYLLSNPYYELAGAHGKDQFIYMAFGLGFNKQVLSKVSIDDITIKDFNDTVPQQDTYTLTKGIFSEDGLLEINQDGSLLKSLPQLNYKTVSHTQNDEIAKDCDVNKGNKSYLCYTLDPCAKSVDVAITFPYGLYAYNDNNDKVSCSVTITPQFSLDGGKTFKDFLFYPDAKNQAEEIAIGAKAILNALESTTVSYGSAGARRADELGILNDVRKLRETNSFFNKVVPESALAKTTTTKTEYGTGRNHFSACNSNQELRYVAHYDFSVSDYATLKANNQSAIIIRLRSNGTDDNKAHCECYCLYYQTVCFDPNKSSFPAGILKDNKKAGLVSCLNIEDRERKFCSVLALRIKSTPANEEKLKKINVITNGIARTWNGRHWSKDRVITRNPASWALEALTSDKHPASRFEDKELDLESFGDFYDYCEQNDFKFDYAITQNTKKDGLLGYILEATGACLYTDIYGRKAVAVDQKQENALAVYNPQNIINIQNKKSFGRRTDGLRIKYLSSRDDIFQEDTYLVMREVNGKPLELTDDSIIKDLNVTGITTYEHIVKYARRCMAIEALRPKTTIIEVGNEGVFYTPFSKVLIQDDSLKIGLSSSTIKSVEWQNGIATKILLTGFVDFEVGKKYGIIINAFDKNKAVPLAIKVKGKGRTNELELDTQISITASAKPEINNTLSFGELTNDGLFTKITTPYIISQIKRSEKGFNLELVNYFESIYETGTIPEYTSNITQKTVETKTEIPLDYVTQRDLKESIDSLQSGTMPVGKPDVPLQIQGFAEKDGISLSCLCTTDGLRNSLASFIFTVVKPDGAESNVETNSNTAMYYFNRETDGYPERDELAKWQVKAKVVNVYGKQSDTSECSYVNADIYGTWKLQPPIIKPRISDRTITLVINEPPRSDNRAVYGNIEYQVQIKRPDIDTVFYKPATSLDPYANEANYKDGAGFTLCDGIYIQTMPLRGQEIEKLEDTAYIFSVKAQNEAYVTDSTEITATACCTSIRDIVKANETAKSSYVSSLSAISANLGVIKSGSMGGSVYNYWNLSTVVDDDGVTHYQGAMRVGGETQYLQVTPVTDDRGQILDYTIEFQIGNFSLTSSSSEINGDLIIQENENSLSRVRLTPTGSYFETRPSLTDGWNVESKITNKEILTQIIQSNGSLLIKNTTQKTASKLYHDIGREYLSANGRVFHFDVDTKNQLDQNELSISGNYELKGKESGEDYTPPITQNPPYSTIQKALSGNCSVTLPTKQNDNYVLDFWLKDLSNEGDVSFFETKTSNSKEERFKSACTVVNIPTLSDFTQTELKELYETITQNVRENSYLKSQCCDVRVYKNSSTSINVLYVYTYKNFALDFENDKENFVKELKSCIPIESFTIEEKESSNNAECNPCFSYNSIFSSKVAAKIEVELQENNKLPELFNNVFYSDVDLYKKTEAFWFISFYGTKTDNKYTLGVETEFSFWEYNIEKDSIFTLLKNNLNSDLNKYFNQTVKLTFSFGFDEFARSSDYRSVNYTPERLTLQRKAGALCLVHSGENKIECVEETDETGNLVTRWLDESEIYYEPFEEIINIEPTNAMYFDINQWQHIGLCYSQNAITFFANGKELSFTKNQRQKTSLYVTVNSTQSNLLLDELYYDTDTTNYTLQDFVTQTDLCLPWAGLDYKKDWFILDAENTANIKSNLFESDIVKQAVLNIAYPVGAIYMQLPQQKEPELLFGGTWQNVTDLYAGNFFRAEGGDSLAFEAGTQQESLPNITGSYAGSCQAGSGGSGAIRTNHGNYTFEGSRGCMRLANMQFNASRSNAIYGRSAHVTPVNQSIRIWKRIA